jgi:hypothetical protein
MTSKQYFISTRKGKIEVKGYPVVIPGYEQFSFFAHRPYCGYISKTGWDIAEEITGLCVTPSSWAGGYSNNTRKGAVAIVVDSFKIRGREEVLSTLKTAIKRAQA